MQTKLYEISPHTLEWLVLKRQEITNVKEDVRKRNPCTLLVGHYVATVENRKGCGREL